MSETGEMPSQPTEAQSQQTTTTEQKPGPLQKVVTRRKFVSFLAAAGTALTLAASQKNTPPPSESTPLAAVANPSEITAAPAVAENQEKDINEQIKELTGINPHDYHYGGKPYVGSIDIPRPDNGPLVVHIGQTHGRGLNPVTEETRSDILSSQENVRNMLRTSGISDVFKEGYSVEDVASYELLKNANLEQYATVPPDSKAWDTLSMHMLETLDKLSILEKRDPLQIGLEHSDILLFVITSQAIDRLQTSLDSQPPQFESEDERVTYERAKEYVMRFHNVIEYPDVVLDATTQLYLNGEINMHPTTTNKVDDMSQEVRAEISQLKTQMDQTPLDNKLAQILKLRELRREEYTAQFDIRETQAMQFIKESEAFKNDGKVALVFGSQHEFSREAKEIFPPDTMGLVTIMPEVNRGYSHL